MPSQEVHSDGARGEGEREPELKGEREMRKERGQAVKKRARKSIWEKVGAHWLVQS